jgi:predicted TIM-barrel fold metal-dependent hydrolase
LSDIVDAHHHIWRRADLPWLEGPMVPRIFGPYEPIRRDYPIGEFLADLAGSGVERSVYVQTNWAKDGAVDEVAWVQGVADARRTTEVIVQRSQQFQGRRLGHRAHVLQGAVAEHVRHFIKGRADDAGRERTDALGGHQRSLIVSGHAQIRRWQERPRNRHRRAVVAGLPAGGVVGQAEMRGRIGETR